MKLPLFGPPANGKTPVEWRMVAQRQSRSPNDESDRPAGSRPPLVLPPSRAVQEVGNNTVEGVRMLEVRGVTTFRNEHEAGALH